MRARRIRVGDVRLSVAERGEGDPVVLLHGFPELAFSWRHQLPALANAGHHAIAPDLRGYGDSDRPEGVDAYALTALAGDIAGLISELGYESAHIVGHDWGGSIAWALAARRPELVRSLSILNSPHPVASAEARRVPEQQRKSWYMLLFQFAGVAEAWLSADDFANLRAFVFDTAAPGTFTAEDRERLRGGAPPRWSAHRRPQLLPRQHPAGVLAAPPARPPADRGPDADHLGRGGRRT